MTVSPSPTRPPAAGAAGVGFANLPRGQVIGTLIGLALALLLSALDQTIVGTAMPRIVAELQGFEHYAGVTTAYLLASTAVVPIVGKLSDLYGRKSLFLGGVLLFLVASLLCGVAQDMPQLIGFRGLQGLGAGIISVMAFAVVGDLFPPARRGRVQGLFGAIFGLASVVGPLLGGYLTDQLSWRWVFLVNLPVGLLALLALLTLFPDVRPPRRQHAIDFLGAGTLVLALVSLLLALSLGGQQYAWTSAPILSLLVFGLAMGALFVWQERRASEPILPLSLFSNSIVSVSLATSTLVFMGMFGTILFIPLFIQAVLGASATTSGTILMPMTGGMIVGSTLAGQFVSKTGRYRLASLIGLGLVVIGMFLLSQLDAQSSYLEAVRDTVIMGFGLGTTMPIFTLVVQNAVPYALLGTATAVTQLSRSVGGTLGAAVFGSLLINRYGPAFEANLDPAVKNAVPAGLLAQLDNPQALLNPLASASLGNSFAQLGPNGPALLDQVLEAIRQALAVALHDMFLLGTVIVLIAFVLCFFLRELPLRRSHEAPSSDERAPAA